MKFSELQRVQRANGLTVTSADERIAKLKSDLATAEQDSQQKQARIERLEKSVKELRELLSVVQEHTPKYYFVHARIRETLKNTEDLA